MSTGIIGHPLPMEKIAAGIELAAPQLDNTPAAFALAADGILTTDRARKVASRSLQIDGKTYHLAGMAKGAGMIAPNMATMLAAVMTDAPLNISDAQHLLRDAAAMSFNRVSVDGHTSTNDTLLLLSSGQAAPPLLGNGLDAFAAELRSLCIELAKQLPADGEGAQHVLQLVVRGAETEEDAELIARTVAASPLVKTAITGGDPNWGRIISAAGYAGPTISPEKMSLRIMGTTTFQDGGPVAFEAAELSQRMREAHFVDVELIVGEGAGKARFWASDLTLDYVRFNAEYTT
jgi:glutamate N-acetyltransferase/amino-acid N-acetyltransferase